jgi:hypothetical protein
LKTAPIERFPEHFKRAFWKPLCYNFVSYVDLHVWLKQFVHEIDLIDGSGKEKNAKRFKFLQRERTSAIKGIALGKICGC